MANVTIFKKRQIWWMQYRNNGTRVRKSLSTKNEKTAHKLARIQEDKILLGECEGHKGRIQFDAFWEVFLPFTTTSKRRKTVDNEIRIWKRFSEWLKSKGMKYLDQITPVVFEKYRLSLLNLGLSQSTVNIAHRHLVSILMFAVRHGN